MGCVELSLAQFCIGVNIVLGKSLILSVPIYSLLLLRFLIGLMIVGPYLLLTKARETQKAYKSLSVYDWGIIFLQAISGGFLFNVFILYGLQYTTATVAGIINSAVPALVALFAFFFLRETIRINTMIAIALCVLGIMVLSFGKQDPFNGSEHYLLGIVLIILAIIPEAMYTIFSKFTTKTISPMATTALINLFNVVLFLPLAIYSGFNFVSEISVVSWLKIFLYGISGGILFFLFWCRGLLNVPANTAAIFMGLMPISTTLLAYIFLKEDIAIYEIIGMGCVLLSIYIGARQYPAT